MQLTVTVPFQEDNSNISTGVIESSVAFCEGMDV